MDAVHFTIFVYFCKQVIQMNSNIARYNCIIFDSIWIEYAVCQVTSPNKPK